MTGQQVERIDPAYAAAMPAPQGGALPTPLEWQALERMAASLADSNLIPYRLKGKPGDVAVILLAAREYGIPPLMALAKLPVVNGTPAPMGELMVALVLRAGHSIRAEFRNPDGSRYKGGPVTPQHYGEAVVRRRDWADGVEESLTFTLEEALTAGLVDRITDGKAIARVVKFKNGERVEEVTPWEQYTPNMARWRAVANVCRLYFPDVLLGLSYLPEELGATVDADGAPVEGIVVDEAPHRQAPPTQTLEQRSAQEAADRLAEFVGPLDVLDKVLAHAEANGYADELVTYDGAARGGRMMLTEAIADRRTYLEATTITPDGQPATAPETPQETPTASEEPPAAPSTPAEPAEAVSEAPTDDPPPAADDQRHGPWDKDQQRYADGCKDAADRHPIDDALDIAREALNAGDAELIRSLYRGAGADLRALDVAGVVSDDDLAVLGIVNAEPEVPQAVSLGSLLVTVGRYVDRHGAAVRDLDAGASTSPSP